MKKLYLIVLMLGCLLLTGCGSSRNEKIFEEFTQTLQNSDGLCFTSDLRCEYPDRTVEFTLKYEQDGNDCLVSVIEPELIAGISVRLSEDGSILEHNSIVIDTGELDAYGLSPLTSLPELVNAVKTGHLESCWEEKEELVFEIIPDDHMKVQLWLDPETLTPTHAELISEGRVCVYCDINNWR